MKHFEYALYVGFHEQRNLCHKQNVLFPGASMQLERAVGKIVKLENFYLESSFQVLLYTREIDKLESFLQLKTFQLHDLSNYPFQLHVSHFLVTPVKWLEIKAFSQNVSSVNLSTQDPTIYSTLNSSLDKTFYWLRHI